MKKTLSIIVAALILFGNVALCSAAEAGLTASVTKTYAKSSFTYGTGGNRVSVELYYYEKHTQTGQTYNNKCSNTVNGAYTTASTSKAVDLGYNFTKIKAKGYVGGSLKATINKLEP